NVHKVNVMDLKVDISNFNREFYSLQKFNINSFYITQDQQIVTVSRFKNKDAAMDYYHSISSNDKFKAHILSQNITVYPMSAGNYSTFYKKKESRPLYEEFFQKNYINK
ncbi:MAG: hypothetical protein II894_07720, partial [Bacteroidales bacterium]|nr:hypothetical protein [Bacteroidales bacterium]